MISPTTLTEMPNAVDKGEYLLRDELMMVVYDELRHLAVSYLQSERVNHTLQPTALVHEAYLRLLGQEGVCWRNREHFIGVAAIMMRRVLVNHAKSHKRHKRGGGELRLSLNDVDDFSKDESLDLEALDEALQKLAKSFPQGSQIVELRYFGGLTIAETASVLKVSDTTVERDWRFARAWLLRELSNQ
jgi:RNA polymerase sigma factor (TIGR02999 family)